MDSKQTSRIVRALDSISKSLLAINHNLASLVEQSQPQWSHEPRQPWQQLDIERYRINHPERCPLVDSDGPPEEMSPTQQVIDDVVNQLGTLKWNITPYVGVEYTNHLDRLIDQLEEIQGCPQD